MSVLNPKKSIKPSSPKLEAEEVKTTSLSPYFGRVLTYFVLILFGAGLVYFAVKNRPELFGIGSSKENQSQQIELLTTIEEVSKIILLPEGEIPTLATVTDAEKTRGQDFFKNAQNGDKVLVYQNAKKAYLYRPDEKKIIEVGTVNTNSQPTNADVSLSPTQAPTATGSPEEISITPSPSPEPTTTP